MGVVRYYRTESDALYHHGTEGMSWGHRNGPPYPLHRFQKQAGNAISKGRVVFNKTMNAAAKGIRSAGAKVKASYQEQAAKKKAEREDMANRKSAASKRAKLVKMGKKHPEWLTDQELQQLNDRKNKENNFDKNYNKKNKVVNSEDMKKVKNALVSEIVTPVAVELGKSAVASVIAGGSFTKIAQARITNRVFDKPKQDNSKQKQKQGNNQKNNQKQQQSSGKRKIHLGKQPSGKAKVKK